MTPGVQLWAVWAMQHVCSKNRMYLDKLTFKFLFLRILFTSMKREE